MILLSREAERSLTRRIQVDAIDGADLHDFARIEKRSAEPIARRYGRPMPARGDVSWPPEYISAISELSEPIGGGAIKTIFGADAAWTCKARGDRADQRHAVHGDPACASAHRRGHCRSFPA